MLRKGGLHPNHDEVNMLETDTLLQYLTWVRVFHAV